MVGERWATAVAEVGHCCPISLPRCVAEGGQVPLLPIPLLPSPFRLPLSPAKREGPIPLTHGIIPQSHL